MKREETISTSWGTIQLAWSDAGISALSLPVLGETNLQASISTVADQVRLALEDYFLGRESEFLLPIDLSHLTLFQQRVLQAVRSIPFGETRSYAWVAERAGSPKGQRAAGQSVGRNPVAIFVP